MHMDTPAAQGILQRYLGPAGLHSWKEACLKEEGWSPWQGWYGFLVAKKIKKHIPTYDNQELGCTLLHWAVSHFNNYFWGSTFHLCGSACQRGCDPWSWSLLSQLDSTICRIVGATLMTMGSETWNHQTALGKTRLLLFKVERSQTNQQFLQEFLGQFCERLPNDKELEDPTLGTWGIQEGMGYNGNIIIGKYNLNGNKDNRKLLGII